MYLAAQRVTSSFIAAAAAAWSSGWTGRVALTALIRMECFNAYACVHRSATPPMQEKKS